MDEKVVVRKRRGRPNRGGGRFNRGRGRGRGRVEHDSENKPDAPRNQAGIRSSRGTRGFSSRGGLSRDTAKQEEVRVPMQRLYMTTENQDMVREMLRDLHGQESDENSEEDFEYDELDLRNEDQYWLTDNTLVIQDAMPYSKPEYERVKTVSDKVNPLAVNKLIRYGFEKQRCIEALQLCDEDIGSAFEYLFTKCFDLPCDINESDPTDYTDEDFNNDGKQSKEEILLSNGLSWEEVLDMRNDEMLALQSIYDTAFIEKISNRVWMLRLELTALCDLVMTKQTGNPKEEVYTEDKSESELCQFYLKGACRFGDKCKYKHEVPTNLQSLEINKDDMVFNDNANFELELRFAKDNVYPLQPPFIGFSSLVPGFPPHICLNITDRLFSEAKELAESQQPAFFSLVSILEDENILVDLISKPASEYSLPDNPAPWNRGQSFGTCNENNGMVQHSRMRESGLTVIDDGDYGADSLTSREQDLLLKMLEKDGKDIKNDNENDEVRGVQRSLSRDSDHSGGTATKAETLKQNRRLKEEYLNKQKSSRALQSMVTHRKTLPAWQKQEDILQLLSEHQVLVVSGMTGCGKTTQVPQFILDSYLSKSKDLHMCNILCTQPRRISAMAVAERVAEERAEKLGRSVGYQIRLEKVQSPMTRLLFCTTGIVLRRLEGDARLEGVTHVIIDEVHERSEESDFLMMYLRDMLPKRRDLKVILMSATLNADLFSAYFNGCPVIDIPGKTFPVEQYFLEDAIEFTRFVIEEKSPYARPLKKSNAFYHNMNQDYDEYETNMDPSKPPGEKVKDENLSVKQLYYRYSEYKKSTCKAMSIMDLDKINFDLVLDLLVWIVEGDHKFPSGAILVFLPGFAEIQQLYETLITHHLFGNRNKARFKVIPLHSTLSSEDQHAVFLRPPEGVTKIVIATNIAETSITIDDIVFVVDAGKMKEKRYDSTKGMESLDTVWVSQANALQRRGRAGRVTSGICFHLFTSHRYNYRLQEQPIPEIQRAPLEQICLRIKMLDIFKKTGVQDVLEQLPEPPEEESIMAATKRLQDLGALDENFELTPLGYHLGSLPVDVRVGKLMLLGAIFRCLDPALTIAATLSFKSPFVSPFDKKDEASKKKLEFATGNSDHLTMVNAYKGWIEAKMGSSNSAYRFCHENFLSIKTLQMLASMKQQFVELLSDIGFVKEGIVVRDVERAARDGSDGVIQVTGNEANVNSTNWKLVSAILVGALYPNVVQVMKPENKFSHASTGAVPKALKPDELKFRTKSDGYVHIHPSSINFQVNYYESPYLVYHEKVKTSRVYIRDCSMVSVYPLLMFGGGSISVDLDRGSFVLSIDDGWIRFMADGSKVAELVRELRMELDQLLSDKIKNPHMDLCTCPKGSKIIDTIVKLITTQ